MSSTIESTGVISLATNHCCGNPPVTASSIFTAKNRKDEKLKNGKSHHIHNQKHHYHSGSQNNVPRRSERTRNPKRNSANSACRRLLKGFRRIPQRARKDFRQTVYQPKLLVPYTRKPGDSKTHTPKSHTETKKPQDNKKTKPKQQPREKFKFLKHFKWSDSQLNHESQTDTEEIMIEFSVIFARCRLDI